MESLKNKTSYVTGAGSGLGREIAIQLAKQGSNVILLGSNEKNILSVEHEIQKMGVNAQAYTIDLSIQGKAGRIIKILIKKYGIDILINNAGVAGPAKEVHELTAKDLHDIYQINSIAPMECISAVVPKMREQKSGYIINISSWATRFYYRNRFAYASSKTILEQLTKYTSFENSKYGIICNGIAPGLIEGERFKKVVSLMAEKTGKDESDVEKACRDRYKLGKMITNEIVANKVIAYLTEPYGQYTNGEIAEISAGFQ